MRRDSPQERARAGWTRWCGLHHPAHTRTVDSGVVLHATDIKSDITNILKMLLQSFASEEMFDGFGTPTFGTPAAATVPVTKRKERGGGAAAARPGTVYDDPEFVV